MRPPLTKRQYELLDYVRTYTATHGYSPTFQEIGKHLGYRSLSTVHEHVHGLEQKGYLRRQYNTPRALEVVERAEDAPRTHVTVGGVRYVAEAELPRLFREWLERRQLA